MYGTAAILANTENKVRRWAVVGRRPILCLAQFEILFLFEDHEAASTKHPDKNSTW